LKNYEEVIAEACRVEVEESTGRVFLVFEIKSEKFKKDIRTNWTKDLEFKLINKNLISKEDE
jgi:hypothetical protein